MLRKNYKLEIKTTHTRAPTIAIILISTRIEVLSNSIEYCDEIVLFMESIALKFGLWKRIGNYREINVH